jgi:hypothetical protein
MHAYIPFIVQERNNLYEANLKSIVLKIDPEKNMAQVLRYYMYVLYACMYVLCICVFLCMYVCMYVFMCVCCHVQVL